MSYVSCRKLIYKFLLLKHNLKIVLAFQFLCIIRHVVTVFIYFRFAYFLLIFFVLFFCFFSTLHFILKPTRTHIRLFSGCLHTTFSVANIHVCVTKICQFDGWVCSRTSAVDFSYHLLCITSLFTLRSKMSLMILFSIFNDRLF